MTKKDTDKSTNYQEWGKAFHWLTEWLENDLLRTGMLLGGVKFVNKGDSWLLVVSIRRSAEGPRVGFFGGRTALHAVQKLKKQVTEGTAVWREDTWAN